MKVHKYSLWNFKSTKEKKWKEKLRKKEIKKEKVQEYSFTLNFTMETFLLQQSPNTTSYVSIREWRHYFSTIWFPSISNKWLEARSVSKVYLQTVTRIFFLPKSSNIQFKRHIHLERPWIFVHFFWNTKTQEENSANFTISIPASWF